MSYIKLELRAIWKEPNLWRAKDVAKKLGFTAEQREGRRLAYEEQLVRQTERAEARADRYEQYAENAASRGEQMQKPLERMRGDTAFFTQPNIQSSSGRAFTNYRQRLFNRYEKGFEEYRKSGYFKNRAETARETASQAQFSDPAYLDRRIKECKKEIRAREKTILGYEQILTDIEGGKKKKWRSDEVVTVENVKRLIGYELELVEKAMDKQGYLENRLDDLGGIPFSRDNVKVGYIVSLKHTEQAEIIGTGPLNVRYRILSGGAAGMILTAAYAEIKKIIEAGERKPDPHPFQVGEKFTAVSHDYTDGFHNVKTIETVFEIVKKSDTTIQLKAVGSDGRAITCKPVKTYGGRWRFSIDNGYGNTFYKDALPKERERTSALDKLDAAKKDAGKGGVGKLDGPEQSAGKSTSHSPER